MPAISDAYSMPVQDVIEMLQTSARDGLSKEAAAARLEQYGPNTVSQRERYSRWGTFASQLKDPQMILLFGAAGLSFGVWALQRSHGVPVEALFITSVGLINAMLGFVQEHRAHRAMDALRQMTPLLAAVVRQRRVCELPAEQIVPGDILIVRGGCIVPADARIIESASLEVVEASLTGESGSIAKGTTAVTCETPLADRSSMLFDGTAVVSGYGRAVVVATGDATELGRIAQLVQSAAEVATPLQRQIASLSKVLAFATGVLAITFSLVFLVMGDIHTTSGTTDILLFSVSLAVASSPEALATIVTLTLALAAHRLAGEGAIVRKMNAIETLGASTVLLCDKTGTMTVNRLTVEELIPAGRVLADSEQDPKLERMQMLEATALASIDAEGDVSADTIVGRDALDQAIWAYLRKDPIAADKWLARTRIAATLPFTSDRKKMSVLAYDKHSGSHARLFTKGAPEVVLDNCTRSGAAGHPISSAERQHVEEYASSLASRGAKVVAVAMRELSGPVEPGATSEALERDLNFLGLITLSDPVRDGVEQTIREAGEAGIRTILITGDHPGAAAAVAAMVGITHPDEVLTGVQIDASSDEELSHALSSCNVLARVTPAHKLRVAQLLQANSEVVAMTGDGVNDAPALRQADVGIALGSGTDMAKQSADVVLTRDNIATIVHAMKEGRLVFGNVRKAAAYLFSCNLSEVLTLSLITVTNLLSATVAATGLHLPLQTEQILWINLVTDTAPALALSFSGAEEEWLGSRDSRPAKRFLEKDGIRQILLYSVVMSCAALIARFMSLTASEAYIQTVTVTALVFSQLLFALTVASHTEGLLQSARRLVMLFGAGGAVMLLQTFVPATVVGQRITGMVPLGLRSWALCVVVASLPVLLHELEKLVHRRSMRRHSTPSGSAAMRTAG